MTSLVVGWLVIIIIIIIITERHKQHLVQGLQGCHARALRVVACQKRRHMRTDMSAVTMEH